MCETERANVQSMVDWANLIGLELGLGLVLFVSSTIVCVEQVVLPTVYDELAGV